MTAKEALALSKRKVNFRIIEEIENAAKEGKTELNLENIWEGEDIISCTEEDINWLKENGYTIFTKTEPALPFYDKNEIVQYVKWK